MTDSLIRAFAPVHNSMQFVGNLYDHAGFFTMRALIDERLMDINADRFKSPALRKAVSLYNEANDVFQDKVFKGISDTYAAGNVGPKPDFKKPLFNLGNLLLSNVGRMSIGQVAVLTLGTGIALVAVHLGSSGNFGAMAPDALSTYLAAKPNSNPEPAPENF